MDLRLPLWSPGDVGDRILLCQERLRRFDEEFGECLLWNPCMHAWLGNFQRFQIEDDGPSPRTMQQFVANWPLRTSETGARPVPYELDRRHGGPNSAWPRPSPLTKCFLTIGALLSWEWSRLVGDGLIHLKSLSHTAPPERSIDGLWRSVVSRFRVQRGSHRLVQEPSVQTWIPGTPVPKSSCEIQKLLQQGKLIKGCVCT